jgi:hypothetical protein
VKHWIWHTSTEYLNKLYFVLCIIDTTFLQKYANVVLGCYTSLESFNVADDGLVRTETFCRMSYKIICIYPYLIGVFYWWLTNTEWNMQHLRFISVHKRLPVSLILSLMAWVHTFPHNFCKFRVAIILLYMTRSSNWSPYFRFSINVFYVFVSLPEIATPDCYEKNLKKIEGAKLLDKLALCLFAGYVYQTLPAVRRLQKGGCCRSPSLYGVRHQSFSRPVQELVLPHDVITRKCDVFVFVTR